MFWDIGPSTGNHYLTDERFKHVLATIVPDKINKVFYIIIYTIGGGCYELNPENTIENAKDAVLTNRSSD
jgi:hypothetical protein